MATYPYKGTIITEVIINSIFATNKTLVLSLTAAKSENKIFFLFLFRELIKISKVNENASIDHNVNLAAEIIIELENRLM